MENETKIEKNPSILGPVLKWLGVLLLLIFALIAVWFGVPKGKEWVQSLRERLMSPVAVLDEQVKVTSEESAVIEVVEKSKDAVVSIALTKEEASGNRIVSRDDKIGTGFIVDKAGLIITNQHVVSLANQKYRVLTAAGEAYDVEDIIIDNSSDLALLKIKADNLPTIELGDASKLKVGQLVIAIGTPLGEYAGSVTTGVVSGLNRSVTTSSGSFWSQTSKVYEDVIQTDAAINPGNSGGPLLNSSGQVIGVNFATTSGADNISFALPVNRVTQRLDEYRKYGKFIHPYMGVEYQMISQYEADYYDNIQAGALIMRVVANSPASRAGIKKDDIITTFGGKKVEGSLSTLIQEHKVGEEVRVEVWRLGKTLELTVKLEEAK